MFLEESTMGREGLRLMFSSLLCKITTLFPDIMNEDSTRNGALCYQTVKVSILKPGLKFPSEISILCSVCVCVFQVCLQMFQLLPEQTVPLVFSDQKDNLYMKEILEFLMNIILGEVSAFSQNCVPQINCVVLTESSRT